MVASVQTFKHTRVWRVMTLLALLAISTFAVFHEEEADLLSFDVLERRSILFDRCSIHVLSRRIIRVSYLVCHRSLLPLALGRHC